jgi:tetratricopeptide (TPR) repeat protein
MQMTTISSILFSLLFLVSIFASDELSALRQHISSNPQDLKSVYQLAVKLHQKKEFRAALKYFKHLVKKRPQDEKMRYLLARAFFFSGRVDEALMICQKMTKVDALDKCKVLATRAKERFPDSYDLFRARRLLSQKSLARAETILDELLMQDVEDPSFRLLLGKIFYFKKRYEFAMDHGLFAKEKLGEGRVRSLFSRLKKIGHKALELINSSKSNIKDKEKFCSRYFLALKLTPEETERRAGSYKTRCAELYAKRIAEEGGVFDDYYRLGYFRERMQETASAQEAYKMALEEAPDDAHYANIEFLRARSSQGGQRKEVVIDLVSSVGGAEAYKMLQEAALKADKLKSVQGEAGSGVDRLGVDKAEFVAQFENYKRKIQRASTQAEKKALVDELSAKYGHLFKNPKTRKELDKFLKSDEGKALKNKYRGQIDRAKEEAGNWK